MKKRCLAIILVLCMLISAIPFAYAGEEIYDIHPQELELLRLTNRARHAEGLPPLTAGALLQKAAGIRAKELEQVPEHVRPDGTGCHTVLAEVGLPAFLYMSENIAGGQGNAESVLNSWLNSPGHRKNIMSEKAVHLGIGYNDATGATYGTYWVQLFYAGHKCKNTGMKLLVSETLHVDADTEIDAMGLMAEVSCAACGPTYIPILSEYCSGYDPEKAGAQTVTVSCMGFTDTFTVEVAHEHQYNEQVFEPTCTEEGYTLYTCACGDSYKGDVVEALGHEWDEGVVIKEPTETERGEMLYTCIRCEETKTETIPIPGHDHSYTEEVIAPTCTEEGYTLYTCACGESYTDHVVDALGHAWDEGTVIVAPTDWKDGEICYTCGRCGDTKTESIPATGKECTGGEDCPCCQFTDMPKPGNWAHPGIDYAVSHGLFKGTSETTFDPNGAMTRAMLVTVLWRYADQPKEGENSFTDVQNGRWFTKAIAWAAHNGIVSGVGNGKFNPDGNITREQMATILYRYANSIDIDTSARGDLNSFADENEVSTFAAHAMSWAVAEGLINGAGGKLMPKGNATRAQVAAILMRFVENVVEG